MPLPSPQPSVESDQECAICHEQLLIADNDNDPLTPSYVIDDVELSCKHHFHQSCILEHAASSADARKRCALCRAKVSDGEGSFWVTVRTENGFVGRTDLGRDIDEQAYFKSHPEAERAQLFLSLMAQSEYEDAEMILKGEDEDENGRPVDPNVTYETGGTTAMHMAALNNDTEGVQLLLKYGADRKIKDEDGNTALDLAKMADAQAVSTLLSSVQQ